MQRALSLLILAGSLAPSPAQADPIVITGGFAVVSGDVNGPLTTIQVEGTQGLRLFSLGDGSGKFGNNCLPAIGGDVCDFGGIWDQIGTSVELEINGVLRTAHTPDAFFGGQFSTDLVTFPPVTPAAVLSAPFRLDGFVGAFDPETLEGGEFSLIGHGLARLELREGPPGFWAFAGSRFDFAPVPEPTTVSLLGLGLVGVAVRRWRAPHPSRHSVDE